MFALIPVLANYTPASFTDKFHPCHFTDKFQYTGPPLIHASLIHDFGLFAVATLAPEFSGTDRQNDAKKPTTMAMMFRQQDIAQQRFS